MKTYKQADCDAIPKDENGIRRYASGNYGRCSFGEWCRFGEGCRFGDGCSLEGNKLILGSTIYTGGGCGSKNRTTYGIPTETGVYIRCGCWSGTLKEFRETVAKNHSTSGIKREYDLMADMFQARWERQIAESKSK